VYKGTLQAEFLQDKATEPADIACGRCEHLSISPIYIFWLVHGDSPPAATHMSPSEMALLPLANSKAQIRTTSPVKSREWWEPGKRCNKPILFSYNSGLLRAINEDENPLKLLHVHSQPNSDPPQSMLHQSPETSEVL